MLFSSSAAPPVKAPAFTPSRSPEDTSLLAGRARGQDGRRRMGPRSWGNSGALCFKARAAGQVVGLADPGKVLHQLSSALLPSSLLIAAGKAPGGARLCFTPQISLFLQKDWTTSTGIIMLFLPVFPGQSPNYQKYGPGCYI